MSDSTSPTITKACDECRSRKTRCIPSKEDGRKCRVCYRNDVDCMRTHKSKRPGPRTTREKNLDSIGSSRHLPPEPYNNNTSSSRSRDSIERTSSQSPLGRSFLRIQSASPSHPFETVRPVQSPIRVAGCLAQETLNITENEIPSLGLPATDCAFVPDLAISDTRDISYGRPDDAFRAAHTSEGSPHDDHFGNSRGTPTAPLPHIDRPSWPDSQQVFPQIDTVLTWPVVIFLLGLYIQHQHHLMPLVHKPTFAQDVLNRRDRHDEVFRALLLSLVAYAICQLPKSEMIEAYTHEELEGFAANAYKASRAIVTIYLGRPTLPLLVSAIGNYHYCKASSQVEMSQVMLAEIVGLTHALGIDQPLSGDDIDAVTRELSRRSFWYVFNLDKTAAIGGEAMLLSGIDQVPPYPTEIDDEYLTSQGHFPQPDGSPSYMTGFVINSKLFNALSECYFRHRNVEFMLRAGLSRATLGDWAKQQEGVLVRTMENLRTAGISTTAMSSPRDDLFATQRANIMVTAAILELAQLELRATLDPSLDVQKEREIVTRTAYELLLTCEYQHLAQSGQSMRCKIFHIVLSVISATTKDWIPEDDVRDWWGVYSQIQWVQMTPLDSHLTLPDR